MSSSKDLKMKEAVVDDSGSTWHDGYKQAQRETRFHYRAVLQLFKDRYEAVKARHVEEVAVERLQAKGDKIYGTVKKDEVGQFRDVLKQGKTKLLINFTVTNCSGPYRTTKHMYKIVFLPTTCVRICEVLPNSLTGLVPVN
ncbi:hypothetical protein Rs2_16711 [Raphanus sativus]|nr:hypothetical protein Rs2_16711 [Raphanus sativus]